VCPDCLEDLGDGEKPLERSIREADLDLMIRNNDNCLATWDSSFKDHKKYFVWAIGLDADGKESGEIAESLSGSNIKKFMKKYDWKRVNRSGDSLEMSGNAIPTRDARFHKVRVVINDVESVATRYSTSKFKNSSVPDSITNVDNFYDAINWDSMDLRYRSETNEVDL
jgi:hypothetical protein